MSAGLPKQFDVTRLAASGGQLEGQVECLPDGRLAGLILECLGPIAVSLKAEKGGHQWVALTGEIRGKVSMTCQRCLDPVSVELSSDVNLGVVDTEAVADALPDSVDPLVSEDDQVDLQALVEDELILALPLVPVHEDCQTPDGLDDEPQPEQQAERENPFAVLKTLKRDSE